MELVVKHFFHFVLSIWILLTILIQFDLFQKLLKRLLRNYFFLNLLPVWKLFAPNPLARDYHIVYRDYNKDGTTSDFRIFESNYFMILHPRYKKSTLSLILTIIYDLEKTEKHNLENLKRIPEFIKLNYLLKRYKTNDSILHRQFAITDLKYVNGDGEFNLIVVSWIKFK